MCLQLHSDSNAETAVITLRPDGRVVWTFDVPINSKVSPEPSGLFSLLESEVAQIHTFLDLADASATLEPVAHAVWIGREMLSKIYAALMVPAARGFSDEEASILEEHCTTLRKRLANVQRQATEDRQDGI